MKVDKGTWRTVAACNRPEGCSTVTSGCTAWIAGALQGHLPLEATDLSGGDTTQLQSDEKCARTGRPRPQAGRVDGSKAPSCVALWLGQECVSGRAQRGILKYGRERLCGA